MRLDRVLRSGNVYADGSFRPLEVGIRDGTIVRVGRDLGPARRRSDFGDLLLLPGAIDGHVHFREPGEESKEGFLSGSEAALRGGVTTVVDMPNNRPPITTPERFERKKHLVRQHARVNIALYAGIPEDLSTVEDLVEAGAVGFKHYMAEETVDRPGLKQALDRHGALLTLHAEAPEFLEDGNRAVDPDTYIRSRPPAAETEGVRAWLDHAPDRFHIAHVSVPSSVTQTAGFASTEITPHHLLLGREDVDLKDFTAVTHPPLRDRETVNRMQSLLAEGRIDLLASDHAPHLPEEKTTSDPARGKPGVPGVETLLSLGLSFAWQSGIPLELVIDMLTRQPAERFGLENRGAIREGFRADLTVVDPDTTKSIRGEEFFSRAKRTPFEGRETSFWPVATFVDGTLLYQDGTLLDGPRGRFLRPGSSQA